jgi:hypothetical protein
MARPQRNTLNCFHLFVCRLKERFEQLLYRGHTCEFARRTKVNLENHSEPGARNDEGAIPTREYEQGAARLLAAVFSLAG